MNGKKALRLALYLFIALTLAFIWSRSMKSKAESRAESSAVMELVRPFLEIFVGKGRVTEHLVRKLAHFCEYGLLGVETTACFFLWKKQGHRWLYLVLFGFAVASMDETIQFFVGRGNQFSDVMLDLFGFVCGMGGTYLLRWLAKELKAIRSR